MGKTKLVKVDTETHDLIEEINKLLLEKGLQAISNDVKKGITTVDNGVIVKMGCRLLKQRFEG